MATAAAKKQYHPWVSQTLASMTLREKVGQLFCPYMMSEKLDPAEQIEKYATDLRHEIKTFAPGGYYLNRYYSGSTPHMIHLLQKQSRVPLFIGADMEAGAGSGLGGVIAPGKTPFPPAMAVGAADYEPYAYKIGLHTALEARALGVNYVFAPVLDVNNNPKNPIINVRSYGEDPKQVTRLARQMVQGLRDGGVISSAKHFPGHGDVSEDTHLQLARNNASRERLDAVELYPYRELIQDPGLDSIMTAHIAMAALEEDPNCPATMSSAILVNLLRHELGFEGVIVTDALLMGGITSGHDPGAAAVCSFEAGADWLLMPPDFPGAYSAVLNAVEQQRISIERVDESVCRILEMKTRVGLNELPHQETPHFSHDHHEHGPKEAELLSYAIACDAVTVVQDDHTTLPLKGYEDMLAISYSDAIDVLSDQGELFLEELRDRCADCHTLAYTIEDDDAVVAQAAPLIDSSDVVLFSLGINVLPDKGTIDIPDAIARQIDHAIVSNKQVILVVFGSPYVAKRFPNANAIICAYGYLPPMAAAVAEVLFGERKPKGTLPVKIT